MEEIKIGEYVRSVLGSIGKVTKIESNTNTRFLYEDKSLITIDKKVYKHSFNIIDLIEVGDYVNGYKVSDKESTLLCTNVKGIDKSGYHIPISQYGEGIETIVTKEQFEIAKYEVIK